MIAEPKGIDFPIQDLQTLFQSSLFTSVPALDKKFYPRVFSNVKNGVNIPEDFEDGEVLFDDSLTVTSWFDVMGSPDEYDASNFFQSIGIVFVVNLEKLFPGLSHRAVEEAHLAVQQILKRRPMMFQAENLITGIEAYGEFNTNKLKFPDMHPWHVFRFEGNVTYELTC
jgi:hypothetical protein